MSNAHYADRIHLVWTTMPSRLRHSVGQTHQLQPHDEHAVVWFPCGGNQWQWRPDYHLLDCRAGHFVCHCGVIRVWYKHRHDPATRLRKKQEKERYHLEHLEMEEEDTQRSQELMRVGHGCHGRPSHTNNYPAQLWTPSRAPRFLTKSQRK